MAETQNCILYSFIFSLLFTSWCCATNFKTNTLDVSGSIHSTLNLFSLQTQQQLELDEEVTVKGKPSFSTSSSSPSFSVEIHPRVFIHAPHRSHKDYKSLTHSRLARDSARVNWLFAASELAIRGITRSTLKPVSACRDGTCLYQVSYGDGSYTVGDFVTETVSFGSSGSVPKVALGCGHDNEGLFVGAAGLLGLGGGRLSLPSQIEATSFSYCLVDRDSLKSSTLEFNSARPSYSVTAPILKNNKLNTFYYVGLTGFSVGGQPVSIPPALFSLDDSGSGGVIVDSGTAITRLPTQAYDSLRDAFTRLTQHLKSAGGVALFDTCYDFSSMTSVKVPTVAMHFAGGQTLDLPAKNYLIPVDSSGTFCFAFAQTTSSMSIIGNVQQQGTRVHFDIAKAQVAFSQNNC
ncbi:hypothetical protein Cgig2_001270 [Carnegiea gigantea]|uniref:Peptidase A1 domain-containing protein n=1 Tax=Carnegiea gigantea TaxID=171969 RepID=A0A9Q1GVC3_9CARY|nr:hypothetical protein Cgig2_001270 [Carnegiea gigantea]